MLQVAPFYVPRMVFPPLPLQLNTDVQTARIETVLLAVFLHRRIRMYDRLLVFAPDGRVTLLEQGFYSLQKYIGYLSHLCGGGGGGGGGLWW